MISILYTISKIFLIVGALGVSTLLIVFCLQSNKIIKELKVWEIFFLKQAARDWSLYSFYSAISNSIVSFFVKKTTGIHFYPIPFWFKLARNIPFIKKYTNLEQLYSPIRKIIDSGIEISNKLRNR